MRKYMHVQMIMCYIKKNVNTQSSVRCATSLGRRKVRNRPMEKRCAGVGVMVHSDQTKIKAIVSQFEAC